MVTYKVIGLHCEGCVKSLDRMLKHYDPNMQPAISLADGTLTVPETVPAATIATAVQKAGFKLADAQ